MVRSMWLFKHKFHADRTLSCYKARLPIHQLDVKNTFLNGDLSETVYMHQPPGFVDNGSLQGMPHELDFIIVAVILHCLSIDRIISSLNNEFDMTDLEALNYFLGISADRTPTGGLQYLSFTRPDLSYAVQQICLYMHDLREPHLVALKRILRYVKGTLDLGLHLYASSTTSLVGYTDADWAGCPSTRRSTSGYCDFLGDNLLSWSAKRQHTLSRLSAEAEYWGVANVVAETSWLRNLLCELHSPLSTTTLVYCHYVSAVYMSANPVQHQRTKHIEIDIHFVRDMVTAGEALIWELYAAMGSKGIGIDPLKMNTIVVTSRVNSGEFPAISGRPPASTTTRRTSTTPSTGQHHLHPAITPAAASLVTLSPPLHSQSPHHRGLHQPATTFATTVTTPLQSSPTATPHAPHHHLPLPPLPLQPTPPPPPSNSTSHHYPHHLYHLVTSASSTPTIAANRLPSSSSPTRRHHHNRPPTATTAAVTAAYHHHLTLYS
ncbi:ribonuclease H-like domain-containing protein [Tanacetum coccineum]|uniref:Ribonuclease H-like domain-containing protein n=1 Tax=Tanacetum coccineum TaxID=301880 RepID=A0ABQ5IJR0_9ASTR